MELSSPLCAVAAFLPASHTIPAIFNVSEILDWMESVVSRREAAEYDEVSFTGAD
jgi:hypothetical protein